MPRSRGSHAPNGPQPRERAVPLTALGALRGGCTFALALCLVWCVVPQSSAAVDGVGANDQTNLTIGLLLPKDEPQKLSLEQGFLIGVAKANEKDPRGVNAVVRGGVGQWGADGMEAARMVTDDQAKGLIAPPSGAGSHLALQVAGRTAVPVISLCPDSSVTKTGVPWMVRVCPRAIDEVLALLCGLDFKGQGMNSARWTIVVPAGRPGRQITRDAAQAAQLGQAPLPTTIEFPGPAADMGSFARTLTTNHPQIILIWLDPVPAGRLVKALQRLGFEGRLGGPGSLRCSEFFEAAGEVLVHIKVPALILSSADQPRYKEFCADYRARFGREPDYMAAMSHDAASLLIYLLGRAGQKPAHEIFPLSFAFPGVTGMLSFDQEGNRQVELQLIDLPACRAEFTAPRRSSAAPKVAKRLERDGLPALFESLMTSQSGSKLTALQTLRD